ncbi:MAG: crossover junction endodeoxyribonuclease RuvC [Cytophagales bacterium]|nr:MAG: crossover junction endodeoxyribonuclease RuvC [Cytophagales bacterium]
MEAEKIILGIDPGTRLLGYALIQIKAKKIELLQYGVIQLAKYASQALKLKKIFDRISEIIEHYNPDEMALESPFYGENIQVAIKLGRAQGVAMAAALSREIPISEYAPRKVKQSVTGNGSASKEQVAAMLKNLVVFGEHTEEVALDATDALAVAVCHYYQHNLPQGKSKSWSAFVKDNPDRIK